MHKINLQLFADAGTGSANSGTGTGDAGATGDGAQNNAGTDGQKAGAKFTQEDLERVATERAKHASNTAMKEYLKQQGVEDAEIAEAIKDFKAKKAAAEEAAKGDLSKLTQKAEAAEKARLAVMETANKRIVAAEAKVVAVGLGVKSERTDYAVRLADLSKVTVSDDGTVDSAALKAAIEAVLKDLPELKGTGSADPASGFRAGSDGSKKNSPNVDDDKIRRIMGLPPKKA